MQLTRQFNDYKLVNTQCDATRAQHSYNTLCMLLCTHPYLLLILGQVWDSDTSLHEEWFWHPHLPIAYKIITAQDKHNYYYACMQLSDYTNKAGSCIILQYWPLTVCNHEAVLSPSYFQHCKVQLYCCTEQCIVCLSCAVIQKQSKCCPLIIRLLALPNTSITFPHGCTAALL